MGPQVSRKMLIERAGPFDSWRPVVAFDLKGTCSPCDRCIAKMRISMIQHEQPDGAYRVVENGMMVVGHFALGIMN